MGQPLVVIFVGVVVDPVLLSRITTRRTRRRRSSTATSTAEGLKGPISTPCYAFSLSLFLSDVTVAVAFCCCCCCGCFCCCRYFSGNAFSFKARGVHTRQEGFHDVSFVISALFSSSLYVTRLACALSLSLYNLKRSKEKKKQSQTLEVPTRPVDYTIVPLSDSTTDKSFSIIIAAGTLVSTCLRLFLLRFSLLFFLSFSSALLFFFSGCL